MSVQSREYKKKKNKKKLEHYPVCEIIYKSSFDGYHRIMSLPSLSRVYHTGSTVFHIPSFCKIDTVSSALAQCLGTLWSGVVHPYPYPYPYPYTAGGFVVLQCYNTLQFYSATIPCSVTVLQYPVVLQCYNILQCYSATIPCSVTVIQSDLEKNNFL